MKREMNLQTQYDWIHLPLDQFHRFEGGANVLRQYESYFELLRTLLPEFNWCAYDFPAKKLPKNFWDKIENQREFMKHAGERLNLQSLKEWRNVSETDIRNINGGKYFLAKYSRLSDALVRLFPMEFGSKLPVDFTAENFAWHNEPRRRAPRDFYKSETNQREYLEFLGKKYFNIQNLDDWYNVSATKLKSIGGQSLLKLHSGFPEMLQKLYPSHPWDFASKLQRLPSAYWDDFNNVYNFIRKAEKALKVTEFQDWYRISTRQLAALGGQGLLMKYKLYDILCRVFPEHKWDEGLLYNKDKRAKQRWLCLMVKNLFPEEEVIEEFLVEDSSLKKPVQVDVYVPSYRLAFEYQGEQHYVDIPAFGNVEMYQQRDSEKSVICRSLNIQLVTIPFWWDETQEAISHFINTQNITLRKET